MIKIIKILILIALTIFLSGCSGEYNSKKSLYQFKYGILNEVPHPKRQIKPIDDFKERMTIEAYEKVSLGVGILVIAFIVHFAFANPIVHTLSNFGIGGGGSWALVGLTKLFVANYILYFCWAAGIALVLALLYKFRGKSITRIGKWVTSLKST